MFKLFFFPFYFKPLEYSVEDSALFSHPTLTLTNCTSGAIWGSSCSTTLQHAAQLRPGEPVFKPATFWSVDDLLYHMGYSHPLFFELCSCFASNLFFFCIAVQTQYLYLFIYSTLAFLILLCHVLYCWASMPRVSNKEKASGRNQKPNYWGLIDMRSCRTKEQNQCPKGVKNVTQSYDLPPKLSPISYWLWARTLHQDHTDDTPSLKVRRPQITLHSPEALCCETSVSYSSCRKGLTLRNIFDFAWAKLQFTGVCSRMTSPNHVRHFL